MSFDLYNIASLKLFLSSAMEGSSSLLEQNGSYDHLSIAKAKLKERLPNLDLSEIDKTFHYVQWHKSDLHSAADWAFDPMRGEKYTLIRRGRDLPRSLYWYEGGKRVLMRFNVRSHPCDDLLVGKGHFKVVKIALDLVSGELFAECISKNCPGDFLEKEISLLRQFDGEHNAQVVKLAGEFSHVSKKSTSYNKIIKMSYLTPLYESDLKYALERFTHPLQLSEKIFITEKLLLGLSIIHKKRTAHGDIKCENILVRGRNDQIEVVFADFLGMETNASVQDTMSEDIKDLALVIQKLFANETALLALQPLLEEMKREGSKEQPTADQAMASFSSLCPENAQGGCSVS